MQTRKPQASVTGTRMGTAFLTYITLLEASYPGILSQLAVGIMSPTDANDDTHGVDCPYAIGGRLLMDLEVNAHAFPDKETNNEALEAQTTLSEGFNANEENCLTELQNLINTHDIKAIYTLKNIKAIIKCRKAYLASHLSAEASDTLDQLLKNATPHSFIAKKAEAGLSGAFFFLANATLFKQTENETKNGKIKKKSSALQKLMTAVTNATTNDADHIISVNFSSYKEKLVSSLSFTDLENDIKNEAWDKALRKLVGIHTTIRQLPKNDSTYETFLDMSIGTVITTLLKMATLMNTHNPSNLSQIKPLQLQLSTIALFFLKENKKPIKKYLNNCPLANSLIHTVACFPLEIDTQKKLEKLRMVFNKTVEKYMKKQQKNNPSSMPPAAPLKKQSKRPPSMRLFSLPWFEPKQADSTPAQVDSASSSSYSSSSDSQEEKGDTTKRTRATSNPEPTGSIPVPRPKLSPKKTRHHNIHESSEESRDGTPPRMIPKRK